MTKIHIIDTQEHRPFVFSRMLKHKDIISSIPMCYAKCHDLNIFSLKKLFMLTNNIILAISKYDTLKPLCIYFKAFSNNAHDVKYCKWCSKPPFNLDHVTRVSNSCDFCTFPYDICPSANFLSIRWRLLQHSNVAPKEG